ncbi:hypothetical protein [Fibrobacter sp.]|nr:hypothetical protein [Fibrobacter sp.]
MALSLFVSCEMRTHEVSSSSSEASVATDRLRDVMIEPMQRTP